MLNVNSHFRSAFYSAAIALALIAPAAAAGAKPQIGQPAPDFTGTDSNGKSWSLSSLRGKTVVLEWTNDGCPYVQKHYNSGNMQSLQKSATDEGVVWLSVISSAEGEQGYVTGEEANKLTESRKAAPTAVILDPSGAIGHAYDAQTTPHMYIIDAGGKLVFMGGIDDKPTTDPASVKTAKNYVRAALDELKAGKPVTQAVTRPYGCSVKYKSS